MPTVHDARYYEADEYQLLQRIAKQWGVSVADAEERLVKAALAQLPEINIEQNGNIIAFPEAQ